MSAPFECGCVWTEEKPAWCAVCCNCNDHCSCRAESAFDKAVEELRARFDHSLKETVRKHGLAVENLTETQFVEALKQAIDCGDFQRHVCASNSSQCVIYIPHAREAYLLNRIKDLEKLLERGSRCAICGNFYPGHATGGADICTCV